MKRLLFPIVLFLLTGNLVLDAQIFYKVEGKNNDKPSYIFGSHHLYPLSMAEESGANAYFDEVEQVVGEIDMTGDPMMMALSLQTFMMAPPDSTLSVLLADVNMDSLNIQFQKWAPMPGMTLQMLDRLKPAAVSTMMAAAICQEVVPGFDAEQQLDSYFMKRGEEEGKSIIGLETPEYQGEVLFNMIPLSVQVDELIEMLLHPDETIETARRLTEAYSQRSLDDMMAISLEGDVHPEYMEALLYRRNSNWLEKLPQIIDTAPSFIVVGALHLAGEKGIIEGLRSLGYSITPLY